MLLQGFLIILGIMVSGFDTKVVNVVFHFEAASLFDVFLVAVSASINIAFPIVSDVVLFLEYIVNIMGMPFAHILDSKVVYNLKKNRIGCHF